MDWLCNVGEWNINFSTRQAHSNIRSDAGIPHLVWSLLDRPGSRPTQVTDEINIAFFSKLFFLNKNHGGTSFVYNIFLKCENSSAIFYFLVEYLDWIPSLRLK